MSRHTFISWTEQDAPYLVAFEVTPAQRQTETDPGHGESLEVTEVNFGAGWEPVSDHQDLDIERLTMEAVDRLAEIRDLAESLIAEREVA